MGHETENENESENNGLPPALIDELRSDERRVPLLSARVDREIERMAAEQFASRPGRRETRRPVWVAIAAAVLIGVIFFRPSDIVEPPSAPVYADVDNSGRIDIADVLALARDRDSGATQSQIDAFAMRIVSLRQAEDAS